MSNKFISINGTRIKKSNIKNFGVNSRKKEGGIITGLEEIGTGVGFWDGFLGNIRKKYIYVTTYQNDNFEFTEDQVDIESVLKELEDI